MHEHSREESRLLCGHPALKLSNQMKLEQLPASAKRRIQGKGAMRGSAQACFAQLSAADVHHAPAGLDEARFADVVARFLVRHGVLDDARHLLISGSESCAQVMLVQRKQTGADLAVAGQPDARAAAAEGKASQGRSRRTPRYRRRSDSGREVELGSYGSSWNGASRAIRSSTSRSGTTT